MKKSRTKNQLKAAIALIVALFFIVSVDATFWSSNVKTNSTSWSIYRQSQNLSFDYTHSVLGTVSPVDYHGRSLSPYHSSYRDVKENDVRMRGRTSAFLGNYSSKEGIYLRSDTTNSISVTITKQANSPIIVVDYVEQWPVILRSGRLIEYSGKEINDREFAGNNLDYVGSSFLYNRQLSRETNVGILLRRMNATVLGKNDTMDGSKVKKESLISAEFMPSREMSYLLSANTSGITDLKYRLTGSSYDFVPGFYPAISEGEERYVGSYSIFRSIYTKSDYFNATTEEDWYPCCFAGYSNFSSSERADLGISAKDVFDCSYCSVPAKDQINQLANAPEKA